MTPGFTVTELAWDDVAIGGIDLPAARLEMVMGFGSGLARRAGDAPGVVWAIGDRGPNLKVKLAVEHYGVRAVAEHGASDGAKVMPRVDIGPTLAELRVHADRVELLRMLPLHDGAGRALTGLPPPGSAHARLEPAIDLDGRELAPDPSGADTEGVVALPGGGFIVGDEYGPSLLHVDADGRVTQIWVPEGAGAAFEDAAYPVVERLPAIAAHRRLNRGFEGLALSEDGTRLIVAFQSPLAHPDKRTSKAAQHVRLWVLDTATGALIAQHLYPLEPVAAFRRDPEAETGDVKLSELVALPDGTLLVLERVSQSTKFFRITLGEALPDDELDVATRPTLEERSAAGTLDLPVVAKTLVFDTDDLPEIGADLEGIAVLSPRELLLVNDNDFGIEGVPTRFWRVTFDEAMFG